MVANRLHSKSLEKRNRPHTARHSILIQVLSGLARGEQNSPEAGRSAKLSGITLQSMPGLHAVRPLLESPQAGQQPGCRSELLPVCMRMRAASLPRSRWFNLVSSVALISSMPLLTSCKSMSGASQETTYSAMTRKKEDRLERVSNPAGFTFLVTCSSGIGGATATLYGGRWPSDFRVRLRYAAGRPFTRLEGFTVATGHRKPMEIRTVQYGPEWAEVQVPAEFLSSSGDILVFDWVDVYRQ